MSGKTNERRRRAYDARWAAWEKLADAAENTAIAYGMGWDMDGVIDTLRKALADLGRGPAKSEAKP